MAGYNPLHAAAYGNHLKLAKYLVANKLVDVNGTSAYNQSPAHIAVEQDNIDILKLLLDGGFDVTQRKGQGTIIDLAFQKNRINSLKLIKEVKGNNIFSTNNSTTVDNNIYIEEKTESFIWQVNSNSVSDYVKLFDQVDVSKLEPETLEQALSQAINASAIRPGDTFWSNHLNFATRLIFQYNVKLDLDKIFTFEYKNIREYISEIDPKIKLICEKLEKDKYDSKLMPEIIDYILKFNSNNQGNPLLQKFLDKFGQDFIKSVREYIGDEERLDYALSKYEVEWKYRYDDKFVLSITNYKNELNDPNVAGIKAESKTYFKDGQIFYKATNKLVDDCSSNLYVLSKHGTLHIPTIDNINHSYIIKGKPGQDVYGYGKPVACGGHLETQKGKIVKIDNSSGHYTPNVDQLLLTAKYLHDNDVLAENFELTGFGLNDNYTKDQIEVLNIGEILESYDYLG